MFNCVIVGHHHRPWIELIEGGPHTFTAFLLSFQRLAWDLFDAHDDSCLFAVCWMYVYLRWITSVDIGISRLMLPRANSCGTTFGVIWNWLYIAELIEWQVGIKDEPKTKRRRSHTNTFFFKYNKIPIISQTVIFYAANTWNEMDNTTRFYWLMWEMSTKCCGEAGFVKQSILRQKTQLAIARSAPLCTAPPTNNQHEPASFKKRSAIFHTRLACLWMLVSYETVTANAY